MGILSHAEPKAVFSYFEELCAIPHGSGNMDKISDYCMNFAKEHSLWALRDKANNVIIKKNATPGYENSEAIILQGHLDMVCQKEITSDIDFEKEGLDIYEDGGYIHANGTTLGADNGIAVAMILAILADGTLSHPPLEAVFTTDEEIGMIGASALDMSVFSAKRMINIDSEDPEIVTVSCAGGSDFTAYLLVKRSKVSGKSVTITLKGLLGGHSGVEIDKGRVNANLLMGRLLMRLQKLYNFEIAAVDGGDKTNAIPPYCTACLISNNPDELVCSLNEYAAVIKKEIKAREPGFVWETELSDNSTFEVVDSVSADKIINILNFVPNGITAMSAEMENLVETSLNMGILKTEKDFVKISFALRSNKMTALSYMEERLIKFFSFMDCRVETGGHYPAWEYKEDSVLRELYKEKYREKTKKTPRVEAIHAGLECGVFAAGIKDLDCISIGPEMSGIHTVQEKLSISSTKEIFEIICNILKSLR